MIRDLFAELIARLGPAKVGQMSADGGVQRTHEAWAVELAGYTPREFKRGLAEVATRRFPPTLGEFAIFCRPCLEPEAAWWEAVYCLKQRDAGEVGDWTHTAVWRAASSMSNEVRSEDFAKHRGRWTAAMKRELARGWGEPVPVPVQVIGYTQGDPVPAPPETMALKRLLCEEQRRKREREAAAKAAQAAEEAKP